MKRKCEIYVIWNFFYMLFISHNKQLCASVYCPHMFSPRPQMMQSCLFVVVLSR